MPQKAEKSQDKPVVVEQKNDSGDVSLLNKYASFIESIKHELNKKTPQKYIKKRQGRGGLILDYVEGGYVNKRMNEIFGPFWEFKIVDKGREGDDVWVLGKLTVHFSQNFSISKEQFGSSKVKRDSAGKPLSLGDDYKSAATDAFKKCASQFGIAADVYWKDLDFDEQRSGGSNDVVVCPVHNSPMILGKTKSGTTFYYHRNSEGKMCFGRGYVKK